MKKDLFALFHSTYIIAQQTLLVKPRIPTFILKTNVFVLLSTTSLLKTQQKNVFCPHYFLWYKCSIEQPFDYALYIIYIVSQKYIILYQKIPRKFHTIPNKEISATNKSFEISHNRSEERRVGKECRSR